MSLFHVTDMVKLSVLAVAFINMECRMYSRFMVTVLSLVKMNNRLLFLQYDIVLKVLDFGTQILSQLMFKVLSYLLDLHL
jgi:hypothetical protein